MKRLIVLFAALALGGAALAQTGAYRLRVVAWSCKIFPKGAIIQGTVKNISGRAMPDLRANGRVIGRGLRMASNSAAIRDRNLQPGEMSSFEVRVLTNFETGNRCELWFRNARAIQIATLLPDPK